MEHKKYKILVLADLNSATRTMLKSTVSLAKMIHGDIHLFYVKRPTEVVKKENQLSAVREINEEYRTIEKQIQNLIASVSNDYNVYINHKFTFGNVKDEIFEHIKEQQPDIIVLGKRIRKPLSLIKDNIIESVLKAHNGVIMIAANNNALEPDKEFSIGTLNDKGKAFNLEFANDLVRYAQKPLKSFKIVKNSHKLKAIQAQSIDKNIVEFVFEQGDNAMTNLSNYLSKNNINLLCIDRSNMNAKNKKVLLSADIKETINKLNVSLLLTGDRNYSLG